MLISFFLLVTFLTAFVPLLARTSRVMRGAALACNTVVFGLALAVGIPALFSAPSVFGAGFWYMDALAGFSVIVIGLVQWTVTMTSVPYLRQEEAEGVVTLAQVRRYFMLLNFFGLMMLVTIVSNNVGFVWVALEATTLATTFLVSFYTRKEALEAAWKYLILCSTGISLGLLGILCMYYGASASGVDAVTAMSWSGLHGLASDLPASIMRIAFVLFFIGFGTKVGLVPMHAWLPDAHSSAPSPISGMLSGVLLNTALVPILRFKALVDAGGGTAWTTELFIVFGVLSCVVPAAFVLAQRDYKRLLAYSSIEHMGIIVFSVGLGGIGSIAAVIHMAGHSLAKSALFFGAGNMLLHFKSTKFETVRGVMRSLPYTGGIFLFLMLALLAAPFSPLFASEYMMVAAGIGAHPIATTFVLLALATIFTGFIRLLMPLLFSTSNEPHIPREAEKWNLSHTAMALNALILTLLGISLSSSHVITIIQRIASIIV